MSVLEIFKNYAYIKIILAIAIIECSVNMYYYGIQFSLEQVGNYFVMLGFSFGINVLITGFIEVIGNTISVFLIDKIPRRKGLFILNLILAGVGLLFIIPALSDQLVVSTIILGICRIFTCKFWIDLAFSQALIPLLQLESFPPRVQSTGTGITEALSQIGTFLTPFIVAMVTNANINPVIIVAAAVLIIGIIPLKFVKETFKKTEQINPLEESLYSDNWSFVYIDLCLKFFQYQERLSILL